MTGSLRMMKTIVALAWAGFGCLACTPPWQVSYDKFLSECLAGTPREQGNYERRAQCWRTAANLYAPPDAGLTVVVNARVAIAQKLDKGDITMAEAEFQLAKIAHDVAQQSAQTRSLQQIETMLLLRP